MRQMGKKSREEITLEIANYWLANDYFAERNKNCGTLVAFDWIGDYLSEINTNIDLGDVERINFYYDTYIQFLKNNKFTFVLGLRNIKYDDNPSTDWLNPLKEKFKSNEIAYDEYIVDSWPTPIPEFDVPDNIFILRYSYDESNRVDTFAASQYLFENFMKKSDWEKYYKHKDSTSRTRIICFCSDVEVFLLAKEFKKYVI